MRSNVNNLKQNMEYSKAEKILTVVHHHLPHVKIARIIHIWGGTKVTIENFKNQTKVDG